MSIAYPLNQFDNVEVMPVCHVSGGGVCDPDDADGWSVYLHLKEGGVQCIADCATQDDALFVAAALQIAFKAQLGTAYGAPYANGITVDDSDGGTDEPGDDDREVLMWSNGTQESIPGACVEELGARIVVDEALKVLRVSPDYDEAEVAAIVAKY